MLQSFSINRRNPGHWDVYTERGRIGRIRGVPGNYSWYTDPEKDRFVPEGLEKVRYNSFSTIVAILTDHFMWEHIAEDGDIVVDSDDQRLLVVQKMSLRQ